MADKDDSDDIYICYKCIGDEFLKEEVRREGSNRECKFCGTRRKGLPLPELAERVKGVLREHFRVTPSDPRDEGFAYDPEMHWERRGEPLAFVIAQIAEVESEIAEAIQEYLEEQERYDAFDGGYENPYGSDAYYEEGRPDTYSFRESWGFFRREIKTRSRFFGRSAQQALDEIFGDLASLKTWEGTPAIKAIHPTEEEARFLFRARIAHSESELREILSDPVKKLGPPPSRLSRAGRMNAAGISVFYGAVEADTCIAEIRSPVGGYVVLGRFEIIRPIRVLDLDVLTNVVTGGSWFDPEFTTRSNRAAFLRHLVEEISQPIMPRDEEFEYLPTQAVSEYLASCVEPRLDGIIFHSAQTANEGRNVVLFHHAAGVEPYVLPEGTEVEVHIGWPSDDDHDDRIVIWETTPTEKPVAKKRRHADRATFEEILNPSPWYDTSDDPEDHVLLTDPTLRLDVQKIEVFRIKAVTYQKTKRWVSRYRHHADKKTPF